MPWTRFGDVQFDALVRRLDSGDRRRRELLALLVRACRRTGLRLQHAAVCHSFDRAVARCSIQMPRTWEDVEAAREALRGRLGSSDEKLAVRGLNLAADQLVHEGRLPRRLRHRARGPCSSCHRVKRIENVRRMLCPACVGARTARARFDRLCARFSRQLGGAAGVVFGTLVEFERRTPPSPRAFNRVWALGSFLLQQPGVRALRTWPDVLALRAAIQADPMRGRRHQALWALHRVRQALLERGALAPLPSQRSGPVDDRLEAVWARFHVADPIRRGLLRTLIDYFRETRITFAAVQVAQAFAYHLARHEVGPVRSWDDIDTITRAATGPGQRWRRRIHTALRRLGDALEHKGQIAPRPPRDALPRILGRLVDSPAEVREINARFLTSLHEHQRRPITLRRYVCELNRFWIWAVGQGIRHPAQVSNEGVRNYLRTLRRKGRGADAIDSIQTQLRGYFDWLRRERLVLVRPVAARERPRRAPVRVCERGTFEKLIAALGTGALEPRSALVLYLLVFHALRNHEIVGADAIGFREHGTLETFDVELPPPVVSVGRRHVARGDRVLHLPSGRYPWLREVLVAVANQRAATLKLPDNRRLFVSESWRQSHRPMDPHVVNRLVARATKAVCGIEMTPALVRQSAGAFFADASDHTICGAMGWSPARAVALGYATREIVAACLPGTC